MTLVKICGIRTVEAAMTAYEAGADFMGFILVPGSKREISPADARSIIRQTGERSTYVGVFKNQPAEFIKQMIEYIPLNYVQLHGDESPEYRKSIDVPVIKAFTQLDSEQMKRYMVEYYLLDRKIQGSGDTPDLKESKKIAEMFPVMFAGGLTPDNVQEVIRSVRPKAVDVSGGIETDGKQDIEKIKKFIRNAKSA